MDTIRIDRQAPRVMRAIAIAGLVFVHTGVALVAQEPPVTPVPLSAEPSHRELLASSDVRVFRVEVAPRAATLLHEHTGDFLLVHLGDADITDIGRDKPGVRLTVPDGTLTFRSRGVVHAVRNGSDRPFRNVTVEFLKPQTGVQNLCAQAVKEQPLNCKTSPGKARVPQFETDQTRADLLTLASGARETLKASASPRVVIALENTEAEALVEIRIPGGVVGKGTRRLRGGDAMEVPVKLPFELHNTGESPSRFLVLEFKNRDR